MKLIKLKSISLGFIFFAALTLISCKDMAKNTKSSALDDQLDTQVLDEDLSGTLTEQTMAYAGSYEGTLPCADCEGIKTTVVLNDDYTYQKTSTYLKGDKPSKFEETGVYELNEETDVITLIPSENRDERKSNLYLLGDNRLTYLNRDGSKVEREMADLYVLEKL